MTGIAGFVAATVTLGAAPASAIGTAHCTIKGTTGSDVINVNVPAGQRVVVCAGSGIDTVNINSIAGADNPATQLWIAFGGGQKTINWNAGPVDFNDGFADPDLSQGIIVRPAASNDIILNGENTGSDGAFFVCGTNRDFQDSFDGLDMLGWTEAYARFLPPNDNVDC